MLAKSLIRKCASKTERILIYMFEERGRKAIQLTSSQASRRVGHIQMQNRDKQYVAMMESPIREPQCGTQGAWSSPLQASFKGGFPMLT